MKILELKNKLEKGKDLGGEIVYIKEDNVIYGIDSVFKNQEENSLMLLRSKQETIKVIDFLNILDDMYLSIGDSEVIVSPNDLYRGNYHLIKTLEFVQYENEKMLIINL